MSRHGFLLPATSRSLYRSGPAVTGGPRASPTGLRRSPRTTQLTLRLTNDPVQIVWFQALRAGAATTQTVASAIRATARVRTGNRCTNEEAALSTHSAAVPAVSTR